MPMHDSDAAKRDRRPARFAPPVAPGGDPPLRDLERDGLRAYLRAIAAIPLLTPEREIDLARRIELADDAARRLRVIARAGEAGAATPDPSEQRALAALVE